MDPVLKSLLENIQKDIKNTQKSIQESEQRINNNINAKFQQVEGKIQRLEETVILQENQLDLFDRQQRQRNVMIYGVQESEKNYDQLVDKTIEICEKIKINDCSKLEIQAARRVGKKVNNTRARPIVVTFTTLGRKLEVLRAKKHLKNTEWYIKEDFPPKVLELRKQLQAKVNEEKEKGNIAYIKYDKIVVRPPRPSNPTDTGKPNNKRNHSESPPGNSKTTKKNTMKEYWRSTPNPATVNASHPSENITQ
ncbi:hypothetical protein NE865_06560 [Phthorimaea operculella]|nr:hypothetical protein NE865_06560 [Phthorimaea operculella]